MPQTAMGQATATFRRGYRLAGSRTWATRVSEKTIGCGSRACRARWPTESGRLRSSRRWAGRGFWGSSVQRGWLLMRSSCAIDRLARSLGESVALRHESDPQPERAGAGGGRGRPVSAAAVCAWWRRRRILNLTLAGGAVPGEWHSPRAVGSHRGAEPDHCQGVAGRGGVAGSWPRRPRNSCENWSPRARFRRTGGMGRSHADGRRHHGRGRLGGPHRQSAGDRALADDAGLA